MITPDDDGTAETFGLIEAFSDRNNEIAATVIGQMDIIELRRTVSRLLALHAVRGKLGTEHRDAGEWVRWMRNTYPNFTM